jgi:hypothetical protein
MGSLFKELFRLFPGITMHTIASHHCNQTILGHKKQYAIQKVCKVYLSL